MSGLKLSSRIFRALGHGVGAHPADSDEVAR
jgi:hypothetical protein